MNYLDYNSEDIIEVQEYTLMITEIVNLKNKDQGYTTSIYTRITEDDWPNDE